MEAQLREYRALKRRKYLLETSKEKLNDNTEKFNLKNLLTPKIFTDMGNKNDEEVLLMENEAPPPIDKPLINQIDDSSDVASETSGIGYFEEKQELWQHCVLKWIFFAMIWLGFFIYFLKIQFGAVYFVITFLIGIYLNTRTGPKQQGEISAYSVFNKDCKSIEGTLTAEQFESEIRYGPGNVKPL